MTHDLAPNPQSQEPTSYEIRIKGHLGRHWSEYFGGLAITRHEDGDTLLSGPITDQAALYGLLHKVRDLGMPLVSIVPLNSSPQQEPSQ